MSGVAALWSLVLSVFGRLADHFVNRRRVRVLAHRACFQQTHPPVWAYFINVTNLSRDRDIEITHVWLDSSPEAHAINPDRRLPKRLKPDEVWETWIEERHVPLAYRGAMALTLGRVRLSTGLVIKSEENVNGPSAGEVPGGPITR